MLCPGYMHLRLHVLIYNKQIERKTNNKRQKINTKKTIEKNKIKRKMNKIKKERKETTIVGISVSELTDTFRRVS